MAERPQLDDQIDEAIAELISDDLEGFALVTSTGQEFTEVWYGPQSTVPEESPRHPNTMMVAALVDTFARLTSETPQGEIDEDDVVEFLTSVAQAIHGRLDPDEYGIEYYHEAPVLPSDGGA